MEGGRRSRMGGGLGAGVAMGQAMMGLPLKTRLSGGHGRLELPLPKTNLQRMCKGAHPAAGSKNSARKCGNAQGSAPHPAAPERIEVGCRSIRWARPRRWRDTATLRIWFRKSSGDEAPGRRRNASGIQFHGQEGSPAFGPAAESHLACHTFPEARFSLCLNLSGWCSAR